MRQVGQKIPHLKGCRLCFQLRGQIRSQQYRAEYLLASVAKDHINPLPIVPTRSTAHHGGIRTDLHHRHHVHSQIDRKNVLIAHYHRAAYSTAKVDLIERYRDYDGTASSLSDKKHGSAGPRAW